MSSSPLEQIRRIEVARSAAFDWRIDTNLEAAVLVGSTARGWFDDESDTDIAIVSPLGERVQLEQIRVPGLSVTYIAEPKARSILRARSLDLADLRILSNLAAGVLLLGNGEIISKARRHNLVAKLKDEIAEFYLSLAKNSLNEVCSPWPRNILAVNEIIQASLLLICAATPDRVLKLKWSMKIVQEESPAAHRACVEIFGLLNGFNILQDLGTLQESIKQRAASIPCIDRQSSFCLLSQMMKSSTSTFHQLYFTQDFLRLSILALLVRSGYFTEDISSIAGVPWPEIKVRLEIVVSEALRRYQFSASPLLDGSRCDNARIL